MLPPFKLNFRRLLLVKGHGSKQFLQGLITKDIELLNENNKLIYTFLLNVKGRIFVDMFIWRLTNILENNDVESYGIEIDPKRLEVLQKALNIYKLRRPIIIENLNKFNVCFCSTIKDFQQTSSKTIINWTSDPRVPDFGYRSLIENEGENCLEFNQNLEKEYISHRYNWGIGEGMEIVDQIPLAMNGDLLNGISFDKELISRTYHSGIVRRRLMPFKWLFNDSLEINMPEDLTLKDEKGQRQGKLITSNGKFGLCLVSVGFVPENIFIRLFDSNGRALEVWRPNWWPKT
uniref:Aminomethyltransferase folate-binding domain-containing protein n=1 Tax=Meloidogyne incognita TaxID=6306 RepID=A0A914MKN7_MELIC